MGRPPKSRKGSYSKDASQVLHVKRAIEGDETLTSKKDLAWKAKAEAAAVAFAVILLEKP